MPNKSFEAVDATVAISDPGEQLREEHYRLDRLVIKIANVVAWMFPILMLAIVAQVTMRKMGHNQAWLDDAQWWMYGFAMVTAFAYAITTNSHVRVDIFHQNFSTTKKAKLEVFALGWLLLPFIAIMVDIMSQYAWASWLAKEGSDSPNGLHRLYLLKISLPILLIIAGLASCSMIRRNLNKFTTPTFLKFIFCAFPFFWFLFDRIVFHVFYWYIHLSQPDLKTRRISKEPLMEHTSTTAIALLIILIIALWLLGRKRGVQ
ncbi:TRAP transporter small permease subunit [Granulosicoccus sp.]|nr:TRAP transporter small permease subunit [Granulosicoccus sp.]MDB4223872.1 TRAP transporter small permease subunit [Granulosicoccus sp.]